MLIIRNFPKSIAGRVFETPDLNPPLTTKLQFNFHAAML